jgi:hypothetical protein
MPQEPTALVYTCEQCAENITDGSAYQYDGETLCEECYDHQLQERDGDSFDNDFPERDYSSKELPEFMNTEKGTYITSDRIFSAEIECYYPGNDTLNFKHQNYKD